MSADTGFTLFDASEINAMVYRQVMGLCVGGVAMSHGMYLSASDDKLFGKPGGFKSLARAED
jgi:hypothetical protein